MELHASRKRVELFGLSRAEMNGKTGVLKKFDSQSRRYVVQLQEPYQKGDKGDEREKKESKKKGFLAQVKPMNIRATS